MVVDGHQSIDVPPEMRDCTVFLGQSLHSFLILPEGEGTKKKGYEKLLFSKSHETVVPYLETFGKSHFPTDVVGHKLMISRSKENIPQGSVLRNSM